MLFVQGLGAAPPAGSSPTQCTQLMDRWGYCGQPISTQDPRYSGGGGITYVPGYNSGNGSMTQRQGSYAPRGTFQMLPASSTFTPIGPTTTPGTVNPGILQPGGGAPIVPTAVPGTPGQQPPPDGLPGQPELQPGTQVTNVDDGSGGYVMADPMFSFGRLALMALGAAAAGIGVGVAIHRRRARAA